MVFYFCNTIEQYLQLEIDKIIKEKEILQVETCQQMIKIGCANIFIQF